MDLQSRVRCGLAAAAIALGVLPVLPAGAQVLRFDHTDRITDAKSAVLILPATAGTGLLLIRCRDMLVANLLPAGLASVTLAWRVDREPAVDGIAQMLSLPGTAPAAIVEHAGLGTLRPALRGGTSLAMRFGGPFGQIDVEFVHGHDTRQSFVVAAASMGVPEASARMGYDHLQQTIIRAVAKQAPDFASLMDRIKVPLRDGNRTREAWELMPQILGSLHASRQRVVVEDMGGVIFGPAWSQLKPLLKLDAAGYRTLNGPAAQQLDWLLATCIATGG